MLKMRAKLTVENVTQYGSDTEVVKFRTVYNCKDTPEDNSYSKYTPSAEATFSITNESLKGQFKPGDKFYVDFTPIP